MSPNQPSGSNDRSAAAGDHASNPSNDRSATAGDQTSNHSKILSFPEYCQLEPRFFFAQAERIFSVNGVTDEHQKFVAIITAIPQNVLLEVSHLIYNPDASRPYSMLRDSLIQSNSVSDVQKITNLLENEQMGDRKPSSFLRHIKSFFGANAPVVEQSVIKPLFLSRLPKSIAHVLAMLDDSESLDSIALKADRIYDTYGPDRSDICGIRVPALNDHQSISVDIKSLFKELSSIKEELKSLRLSHDVILNELSDLRKSKLTVTESSKAFRYPSKPQQKSESAWNTSHCYYHAKFGPSAAKCVSPCSWSKTNSSVHLSTIFKSEPVLFHVLDSKSKLKFLIDTGAALSVIPASRIDKRRNRTDNLHAANGSIIKTYGRKSITLDLGLRRTFQFLFILAEVREPIIGADFLHEFNIIVDMKNKQLIDQENELTSCGVQSTYSAVGVSACNPKLDKRVRNLLDQFPNVTHNKPFAMLPPREICHVIETVGQPVFTRPYKLSPEKEKIAKDEFAHMMQLGIIRPSKSPWASPLTMVPKQSGEWRYCGDYRKLNNITVRDSYPIPFLQNFAANFHGCKVFSKVDLAKAFNQIPMNEEDIPKTAVCTPFGLFEWLRMPYGLKGSSQTFQRFLDGILRELNNNGDLKIFGYVDDILVGSTCEDQHLRDLQLLFQALHNNNVVINISKCEFLKTSLTFLGHVVSSDGIKPTNDKVKVVESFPKPITKKDMRRFLGLINFYHRFIPRCAEILAPLNAYLKGSKVRSCERISWTEDGNRAFLEAKSVLAKAAMLTFPIPDAETSISVDASDFAVGGILQQKQEGFWKPIAFFSKALQPREQKYSAFSRELLAMYLTIKHFQFFLQGRDFTVFTDHMPLCSVMSSNTERSPRETRQLDFISQFTKDVRHVSGVNNQAADALSRINQNEPLSDLAQLYTIDNFLPDTFHSISLEQIAEAQASDPDFSYFRKHENFFLHDNVGYHRQGEIFRPFVPLSLRRKLFENIHNLSHPGIKATQKLISKRYYWKSMNTDVREWTRNCLDCQTSKVVRHNKGQTRVISSNSERFSQIHMDIVGPLPFCEGKKYLLTIIDRYTRWPEAIPIADITSQTVVKAFSENWVARFGAPSTVTTDRGSQFESCKFNEFLSYIGCSRVRTTAYHPQSNGLIERFHRRLKEGIKARSSDSWVQVLPSILLGIRTAVRDDTDCSPSEMLYGTALRLPGDLISPESFQSKFSPSDFTSLLKETMRNVKPACGTHSESSGRLQKSLSNATHVFLRVDSVKTPLQKPYIGPFLILGKTDKTVTISRNGKTDVVSIDRVKTAHLETDFDNLGEHTSKDNDKFHAVPSTVISLPKQSIGLRNCVTSSDTVQKTRSLIPIRSHSQEATRTSQPLSIRDFIQTKNVRLSGSVTPRSRFGRRVQKPERFE